MGISPNTASYRTHKVAHENTTPRTAPLWSELLIIQSSPHAGKRCSLWVMGWKCHLVHRLAPGLRAANAPPAPTLPEHGAIWRHSRIQADRLVIPLWHRPQRRSLQILSCHRCPLQWGAFAIPHRNNGVAVRAESQGYPALGNRQKKSPAMPTVTTHGQVCISRPIWRRCWRDGAPARLRGVDAKLASPARGCNFERVKGIAPRRLCTQVRATHQTASECGHRCIARRLRQVT